MTIMRRTRRFGAALLLTLMAAVYLPLAPARAAGGFADVSGSDWYYDPVNYVVEKGLFKGTSDTVFSPNVSMSRAMFVTVLGRFANVDPSAWTGGASFSDVAADSYYAGYAAWAKASGIVTGTGQDQFSPNASITREQMCAMLNRFAAAMGLNLSQTGSVASFPDSDRISSWAKSDVDAMQLCGVLKGNANGLLNPLGSATRAEAATMLMRFDSACGGSVQTPPTEEPAPTGTEVPAPTEEPATDSTKEPAPPTEQPSDPNAMPDTPVSLVGGTVGVKAGVIRVGVLVKTQSIDTSVPSVTLQNTNGTGFEYGSMSGRQFVSVDSIQDTTVSVTTDGAAFTLSDSVGNVVYTTTSALAVHPVGEGKTVTRVNGEYKYFGDFELSQASGKTGYITVVNYVGVEDYVKGVVPYEFSSGWPAEALKAAAIACRSYAMSYDWSIYSQYGMDIVTGSGTQLYRGRGISYDESYFAASDAAVDATGGQYLTYNGSICVACFSSCDGGHTLDSAAVFGTSYPYLTGKADPYEQAAVGDIAGSAAGSYESIVGASHKVGMSAWGCYAMAKYYNKSCEAILGFYYTGADLQYGA